MTRLPLPLPKGGKSTSLLPTPLWQNNTLVLHSKYINKYKFVGEQSEHAQSG